MKQTWKNGDLVSTHRYIRAINSSDLNPAARRCGVAMAGALGLRRAGLVVASTRFLAIICNGGRSTAQEAIKELIAEGWIEPAGTVRRTNAFRLVFAKAEQALEGLSARLRAAFDGDDDEMDLVTGFNDDHEMDRAAVPDGPERGPHRTGGRSSDASPPVLYEARYGAIKRSNENQAAANDNPPGDWPVDWRDQFWNTYPVRKNVSKANEELISIAKTGVKLESILVAVRRYARQLTDIKYCANPVLWLQDEPWRDNSKPMKKQRSGAAI